MWERWNSYTIKNGFGPVSMNSFNHYAYGAVQDWMMMYSAGIQRDEKSPAYKHIILQPRISRSLDEVKASYNSVYGKIESHWIRNKEVPSYTYYCTIPANTEATLNLKVYAQQIEVLQGKESATLQSNHEKDEVTSIHLEPGQYTFRIND